VPELAFQFDESVAHQARVEELLEQIKQDDAERAAESAPDGAPGEPSDNE
jgi:hypothetical protein